MIGVRGRDVDHVDLGVHQVCVAAERLRYLVSGRERVGPHLIAGGDRSDLCVRDERDVLGEGGGDTPGAHDAPADGWVVSLHAIIQSPNRASIKQRRAWAIWVPGAPGAPGAADGAVGGSVDSARPPGERAVHSE